jgi:hypothetical protein
LSTTRGGPRRELALLAVAFLASLPLVTPRIYASDEVQYFAYLRSLWFDGDLSFENEYRHFYDAGITRYDGFHETFLERRTEATGLRVTFATLGPALLWSPFYAAADAIVRVQRGRGAMVARDGFSQPYISAVAYGSAFYGWLAVVIGWWMTRRLLGARHALASAVAVWIGTPLFFYMYVAPPMSHACSAFAVAVFLATWLRVRERWTPAGCAALGGLAALMTMVREQDGFIAIAPAADWIWTLAKTRAARQVGGAEAPPSFDLPRLAGPLVGILTFVVAYAPQLWAYMVLNGYPGPSRLVARKMNWISPHALGVLLSPNHGLLFWTPLVLLSLAGLMWLALAPVSGAKAPPYVSYVLRSKEGGASAPPDPWIARCLLLAFASQVYVAGSVESWSVAGAFGQRRFLGLTAVLVVGLAALWVRASPPARPVRGRTAMLAAVGVAVWWNVALIVQFGAGLMDRQRLELARNAYHAFVTIPARLPNLAYRYVFERGTFYKPPAR